jgi:hypothetical protein
MSAYKQFTTQDVVITPFDATKTFITSGSEFLDSDLGIEFYTGINPTSSIFTSTPTGLVYKENTTGVYNSIKQLYYTNYISSSTGDNVPLPVLIPGISSEFDETVGEVNAPRFDNYLQSTLTQSRYFPTQSGAEISVISIPSRLFGENIVPSTFDLSYYVSSSDRIGYYDINDDGDGNLISEFNGGEIFNFYGQNQTILTNSGQGAETEHPRKVPEFIISSYNYLQYNPFNNSISFPSNSISNTASVTFSFSGSNFQPALTTVSFFISSSLGVSNSSSITPISPIASLNVTLYADIEYFITYKPNQYNSSPAPQQTFDLKISAASTPINYTQPIPYTVGQIFYSHGIATFTTGGLEDMASKLNYLYLTGSGYGVGNYGQNIYGVAPTRIYPYLFSSSLSFMSSYRIYENQYKCTIRENEFNYTQNPSARSGSGEFYYSFVTGSFFSPYVTTIGLYNDAKELLVVGKLSQPVPISLETDTTFIVNFDI